MAAKQVCPHCNTDISACRDVFDSMECGDEVYYPVVCPECEAKLYLVFANDAFQWVEADEP